MDRFTISLDSALASAFDRLIEQRAYATRSEAVRDLLRTQLQSERQRRVGGGRCVAALSYIYRHRERQLAERLVDLRHAHHDVIISATHAHIDHENCLEAVLLRGPVGKVRGFAALLVAERGVRHGSLNLISVELTPPHSHGGAMHRHLRPCD